MPKDQSHFLETLKEKGYSPKTILMYKTVFKDFGTKPINKNSIAKYQSRLLRLKVSSRKSYLNCLKQYLVKTKNPLEKEIVLPKLGKELPQEIPSQADVSMILQKPDVSTFVGIRDRAMLEVLYSTGMRNAELRHLKLEDIDWVKSIIRINSGKLKKDRIIPISSIALGWVKRYQTQVRLLSKPQSGHLFVSLRGASLGNQGLHVRIRKYGRYSSHKYRHACATHLMENGMKETSLQRVLGHANLSSTQIYTHVSITELQKSYMKYHPRDRWGEL